MARLTRSAWSRVLLASSLVVAVDQLTKALVRGAIAVGATRTVIPGVLELVHTTNSGVAFSALTGSAVVVTLLAVVVLAALLAYFSRHTQTRLLWLATGLIAGGAIGNLIDRLRLGAVTDFIKLPDWPAFNAADSAITVGVIALILLAGRREANSAR